MTRVIHIFSAVLLASSLGCATHQRFDSPAEVTLPVTTPYDSDPSSRSEYLAGYQTGYRDYLVGKMQTPFYEAGQYPVAERGGYMAGIAAAMETWRKSVSHDAGVVE